MKLTKKQVIVVEVIVKQLQKEVDEKWSEGNISGDEALASRYFIEKFAKLISE